MLAGALAHHTVRDGALPCSQVADTYDECVFRDDTMVLLEMTTRDMMEVRLHFRHIAP